MAWLLVLNLLPLGAWVHMPPEEADELWPESLWSYVYTCVAEELRLAYIAGTIASAQAGLAVQSKLGLVQRLRWIVLLPTSRASVALMLLLLHRCSNGLPPTCCSLRQRSAAHR